MTTIFARTIIVLSALIALILFSQNQAQAFPDMVRHGYVNCTSCHVSPNGGGVLNAYGRELSREILSATSGEKEHRFAYFIDLPEWLNAGGDVRALQLYRETTAYKEGRFIWMQSDLEASQTMGKFTLVESLGYRETSFQGSIKKEGFSRKHYLTYKPIDEVSVRAGKFLPEFGINTPEHTLLIRRSLGFDTSRDETSESYNVEAAWLGEKLNVFLTYVGGRPDNTAVDHEKAWAASGSWFFSDRFKVGLSGWSGSNSIKDKTMQGPFALLGWLPNLYSLHQGTWIQSKSKGSGATQSGFVSFNRVGFEPWKGFQILATHQFQQMDLNNSLTLARSYGPGLQYFPRPHLDFQLLWDRTQTPALDNGQTNELVSFLGHFYF